MSRRRRPDRGPRRVGRTHGLVALQELAPKGTGAAPGATMLEAMLDLVRGGASPRTAALAVGVPAPTYHRWMAQAGEERAPAEVREFRDAVERARASWRARLSLSVTTSIPRNPMVGVRLLQVAEPDEAQWRIGEDAAPPQQPAQPTREVHRSVIMVPAGMVPELARRALLAEAADAGLAEDEDDGDALEGFVEVATSPSAEVAT